MLSTLRVQPSRWLVAARCGLRPATIGGRGIRSLQTVAQKQSDQPLRILFCGTDEFSVASLRALHRESQRPESSIVSIDVVTRPDKRAGRGLKELRIAPIKPVAQELGLPVHQIDTFTGWSPPLYGTEANSSINLVIAVSFGLLIPQRILKSSRYGGINVHPSLLPDLRGAAPIQWSIMKERRFTGISIQSLHPSKFDEGVILAQSPPPGIAIPPSCTSNELQRLLAPAGADALVKAVQSQLYRDPYEPVKSHHPVSFAPKINTAFREVDLCGLSIHQILRMHRAIAPLWANAVVDDIQREEIRIIFRGDMYEADKQQFDSEISQAISTLPTGLPFSVCKTGEDIHTSDAPLLVKTCDGSVLAVSNLLVSGSSSRPATQAAAKAHLYSKPRPFESGAHLHVFHEPLRRQSSNKFVELLNSDRSQGEPDAIG